MGNKINKQKPKNHCTTSRVSVRRTDEMPIVQKMNIKEEINKCNLTKNYRIYLPLSICDFQLFKNSVNLLIHLRQLDINYTWLNILPKSIGQLINLETLTLYGNELKSIPNSIGQLTKLQYLHLQDNQLEIVPNSIGNLINLKELYLFNNKLQSLPREIQRLTNFKKLRKLYVESNKFKSVPLFINDYYELTFNIRNNPIKDYYLYNKYYYYNYQKISKTLIHIQRMYKTYIFLLDFYSVY